MSSAVRRLLPYVSRYRRAFCIGMACVLLTTTFQLLSPWVLKYAIDDMNRGVTRAEAGARMPRSCWASRCVRGMFLFLMRRIIIGASRDIEYDIRNDFFARLEQLPLGYYHSHRTGRPDVARHERSQCRAHDDRSGDHVLGQHRSRVRRRHPADVHHRSAADADRADPAAVRLAVASATSAAPSTSASRRFRRSCRT